jgi:hypothetical protein
METLLYIASENLPPKSARNCKQELKVIDNSITKRNINGDLIALRKSRKLWTRISCTDQKIPAILTCELGDVIDIGCIQRLWKKVTPGSKFLLRHKPCAYSVCGHNKHGDVVHTFEDRQEEIAPKTVEFVSYRPWLSIMITKIETTYHEWDQTASWILEGEEV